MECHKKNFRKNNFHFLEKGESKGRRKRQFIFQHGFLRNPMRSKEKKEKEKEKKRKEIPNSFSFFFFFKIYVITIMTKSGNYQEK